MARIIAFYLPQYHPIPENDEWWGPGFTEWVNVAKARPLFRGHKQPHIPADLGFYDLRIPEIRIAQANLAYEAGIEGFCYWHYWFGDGKRLLEKPFNEVVESKNPNFPFCLAWANHSWYKKNWNPDSKGINQLLIEQRYLGESDNRLHFYSLLQAFKDIRYIRVDDKLVFMVYDPLDFQGVAEFIILWRKLAKENGLNDFYFIGAQYAGRFTKEILEMGFDAVYNESLLGIHARMSKIKKVLEIIQTKYFKHPRKYNYADAIKYFNSEEERQIYKIPGIKPNWDHTPRSKNFGTVLVNSSPKLFYKHVIETLDLVKNKPIEKQIIFLKSWNEWGEGNYMEPDIENGKAYIEALHHAITDFNNK